MPVIIETPEGTGEVEGLVLNGLDLNSGPPPAGDYMLESVDFTPPSKKPEWAQAADADGADLIRTPLFENRVVTAKVRIEHQATMNEALMLAGAIVDQIQEAEKNPGGIPLIWTPANSTKSITFYVLTGSVAGLPVVRDGEDAGWFVNSPVLTLRLECKPFGYGEEVSAGVATTNATGAPYLTLTVADVPGDVPAEGRLIVTDKAAVGRRYVEWGLENRYYNAATSLFIDSEDLTPVGGAQSDAWGGYQRAGASHHTIATNLFEEPTICCLTGNLSHIGTFRVKARIAMALGAESILGNTALRLSYQDGEGPFRANTWATPILATNFIEADLGIITITPAEAGTQKWNGRIEAYSANKAAADVLHVDYLTLIPITDGYGKARGVMPGSKGQIIAFDNFTTEPFSGSLNARTAALGGKWATSGSTTDFAVKEGKSERATTSDTEPRLALLGTSQAGVAVALSCEVPATVNAVAVMVRRVDATNYCLIRAHKTNEKGFTRFPYNIDHWDITVVILIAGVETMLGKFIAESANKLTGGTLPPLRDMRVVATTDGTITVSANSANFSNPDGTIKVSAKGNSASFSHAALRTGETLASGICGFYDYNSSGEVARIYNSFSATALASVPYCIQPSRALECRSASTIMDDSTGTYYGPVPQYRGSRFFVPQAGSANRTSRILIKADRNDLEEANQSAPIGDSFSAQVFYTPRYHVIPR